MACVRYRPRNKKCSGCGKPLRESRTPGVCDRCGYDRREPVRRVGPIIAASIRDRLAHDEYPDDQSWAAPEATAEQLLIQADWHDLAVRWADFALEEIAAGHADMAGERARGAYRFCLQYQLSGGRPDAK